MSDKIMCLKYAFALSLMASAASAWSYDSGSTGADGAFNPIESATILLPPDGVFNYTSFDIPTGVTITYQKNAANTPVTILVSGDATIAGTINVSATPPLGAGNIVGAGLGGPGGFNGGPGGQAGGVTSTWTNGYAGANIGGPGVGPGGGSPGRVYIPGPWSGSTPQIGPGGGGAYGSAPPGPGSYSPTVPGVTYGNIALTPLVGGSGGGGGVGGVLLPGTGGGGGGGAILIAVSGTLNVTGAILANGGVPVSPTSADGRGSHGGAGSGGAIRLIATTITGNGTISAAGGSYGGENTSLYGGSYYVITHPGYTNGSQNGGAGRIRLESETLTRTAATSPPYVGGIPSVTFVPGLPTLRIASVAGVAVSATPTGAIALPTGTPNPVTVTFTTSGVTVGSSIKLTVNPARGQAFSVTSAPTTGTTESATASVDVDLPVLTSILQASVTYTIVASLGDALGNQYAKGERVERIELTAGLGGESTATLITVSGKRYPFSGPLPLVGANAS